MMTPHLTTAQAAPEKNAGSRDLAERQKDGSMLDQDVLSLRRKPRLLFFQWDHRPNAGLSDFLLAHTLEHVKCLETQFEVIVINRDCNFAQLCDLHEPDLCMFESGYETWVSLRPRITNLMTNTRVPRIGFHNADSWSTRRAGFLSDMAIFGCEAMFSICATTPSHMPSCDIPLFIWPNFINPEVFRDHGLAKVIPVMLSGQRHELYPWRAKAFPIVEKHFATLNCPPFQYGSGLAHRSLTGLSFSRAINASQFALTCGTMAREVVRKHLEIPASASCLVTEGSEALRQAGFRHMVNCIFADTHEVVDAMDEVARQPDLLAAITRAGHQLVHERHTLHHRPQILEWFRLRQKLAVGEQIVQDNPFGGLRITDADETRRGADAATDSLDRIHLTAAYRHLASHRLDLAADRFRLCLGYVPGLPEAKFGLALCALANGEAGKAAEMLAELISGSVADYGAEDPDPREWAYYLVSVLARGSASKAEALRRWYPRLDHAELRFIDIALARITGKAPRSRMAAADRPSIHPLPLRDLEDWLAWLAGVLTSCGQQDLAHRLLAGSAESPAAESPGRPVAIGVGSRRRLLPNVPFMPEFRVLRRIVASARRRAASSAIGSPLRRIWRRYRGRMESANIRRRLS